MNESLRVLNASAATLLLDHVWPMLWQSSLLIVLVALAGRTVFRKSPPQLRYALWGLVLIRLVVPPWVDLPTALGHWGMPEVREQVAAYVPLDAAAPAATAMLQRPLVGEISPEVILPATDGSGVATPVVAPSIAWSWATLLVTLWGLGVASLFLLLLIRLLRMRHALKQGAVAPDWVLQAIADYRSALGVRWPVRTRVVAGKHSPALMGLLRPTILLPEGTLKQLQEDQLRAILAHEIAHVKRWDFLVNWAQVILGIAYFFHPLLWFANREMRRERELACDDLTLITLGLNREGYAESLLRVAEGLSTVRRLAPVQVGIMEGELELARRLRRILDQKIRPVPRLTALSLAIVIAFAAVFGTWHQTVAENKTNLQRGTERFEVLVHKPEAVVAEEKETLTLDVKVVDEDGQPVEGATIQPMGLRTKVEPGSHYGNGGEKVTTNREGVATITYPRYVTERMETGQVTVSARHSDYATGGALDVLVDGTSPPIVLQKGMTVRVSGFIDDENKPVLPLFAQLSGTPKTQWEVAGSGNLKRDDLLSGPHSLLLAHRAGDGTLYFSDYFPFDAVGGENRAYKILLREGVRLVGALDGSVPRPVKNGWVEVRIRPEWLAGPGKHTQSAVEWIAQAAVDEDGSFLIEGLPRGRGEITAGCDGAVSSGERPQGTPASFGAPVVTTLDEDTNEVEVSMVATATAVVRALGPDGQPVMGTVQFSPNIKYFEQYTTLFEKRPYTSAEEMQAGPDVTELFRRTMSTKFESKTDHTGTAIIQDLPPWADSFYWSGGGLELPPNEHQQRQGSIELHPGETTEVKAQLIEKGNTARSADVKVKASDKTPEPKPTALPADTPAAAEVLETKNLEVKVVDVVGAPIEGALLTLTHVNSGPGLGSVSGLRPDFGKPDTVKTNASGMAAVRYPRYVVEKKETVAVALIAGHAKYVSGVQVELKVDDSSPTIVLERGATLRVSGYLGERQNTVTPLFAKMSGSPVADWRPAEDGILERRDLWAKQHYLLLIHQDREGFLYFTDYFRFYPTQGMTHEFNLPLQKGVRLAGKVSESVARPVKNGWVEVRVLPSEANLETIDYGSLEWIAHSAINEDGSFVIEDLPRGQGRITAACDGAVSTGKHGLHGLSAPVVTTLDREFNDVEVTMVPTATAVVRVTGPAGKPVAGAKVGFWPFVGDIDHYFAYFRKAEFSSAEAIKMPLEESATDWEAMAEEFSYASDVNGIATIENLPPWVPRFSVVSEDFELPPDVTGARRRSIELRPGETTEVAVELVAKGIGISGVDAPVASAAPTDREKANASSAVAPSEPRTDQSEAAAPEE